MITLETTKKHYNKQCRGLFFGVIRRFSDSSLLDRSLSGTFCTCVRGFVKSVCESVAHAMRCLFYAKYKYGVSLLSQPSSRNC